MTSYIYALILTAVISAVVELMAPGGKDGRLTGHIRLVAGLCLLVALIQPLREGLGLIRDAADGRYEVLWPEDLPGEEMDYESIFSDELSGLSARETEAWVSSVLESRFGIPAESREIHVTVAVGEDGRTPMPAQVNIVLTGQSIFKNPHEIETFVSEQLGCPCVVAIG